MQRWRETYYEMYSSAFQGGDSVELLSLRGKDPEKRWGLSPKVTKQFDDTVRGFVLVCVAPGAKMELPGQKGSCA